MFSVLNRKLPLMSEITEFNTDMVHTLSNGVEVLSTTWHPVIFEDGTTVQPSGFILNAKFESDLIPSNHVPFFAEWSDEHNIRFVNPVKKPTEEGLAFVMSVPHGILILGSAIAAEAYGFPVVSAVPTPDSIGRGADKDKKRVQIGSFNVYGLNE